VTDTEHPTIDAIADLQEGLLPAEEAGSLQAHLDGCAQCRETATALTGVSELLATEGQKSVPLPAEVEERLHARLRQAAVERASGVPALEDRRSAREPRSAPRLRRWVLGAAAAAAAFVVVGGSLGVLTDDEGSTEAGDAGGDSALSADPEAAAPNGGQADGLPGDGDAFAGGGAAEAQRVRPEGVRRAAQALAAGTAAPRTPAGGCALVAGDLAENLLVSQYGSGTVLGLLVVDRDKQAYRLVDCEDGALILRGAF
jgi:hypothetical protein